MDQHLYRRDMTVQQATLLLVSTALIAVALALAVSVLFLLASFVVDVHPRVWVPAWGTAMLLVSGIYLLQVRDRLQTV